MEKLIILIMEHISSILSTLNESKFTLILVVAILGLLTYLIKTGILSFKGHGLKVGFDNEDERAIIRLQMEYMATVLDGTIVTLPNELKEGPSYYRAKYIISKVKDLFETIIVHNHIKDDEEYISIKQELVYNTILKLTDAEYFQTEEFKKYINNLVSNLIKKFTKIRKYYMENNK